MKKLNTTKLLVLLLALCLVTSSFVGGTLAKYVTTDSASDTARVAKWGVALQAEGNLYGKYYKTGTESIPTTTSTANELSVASANTSNVLAPGTKSENGLKIALNGNPEVRTKVTVEIKSRNIFLAANTYGQMVPATVNETSFAGGTYYTLTGNVFTKATSYAAGTYYTLQDEVATAAYYPVVYSSTDTSGETYGNDSLDSIADAYMTAFAAPSGLTTGTYTATEEADSTTDAQTTRKATITVDPNTDLSKLGLNGDTISWAWAFEGQNDVADTILGLLENTTADSYVVKLNTDDTYTKALTEYTDYCLDTDFNISINVEQVD